MRKNIIELKNISKKFDNDVILDNFNLSVKENEFLTLLGPSGCGKTTTLKIISGFLVCDKGKILFNNQDITDFPPNKRNLNTVFQRYALFPHMNVYENIAFGLKIKKLSKKIIDEEVKKILKLVSLSGFEKRSIASLSGGQQQRVAIARALVNKPKVLLLDEPLAALDYKLRKEMQLELKKIQQELGITFIFVTHDQEEALTMSDTIVVMNKGKIQQMGTPEDIYNEPSNAFVANFIGESNIVDGIIIEDYKVSFCNHIFECVDKGFLPSESIDVVIRPEDIKIVDYEDGMLKGTISSVMFKGVHYEIIIKENKNIWKIHTTKYFKENTLVGMDIYPEDIHIMKKVKMIDEK